MDEILSKTLGFSDGASLIVSESYKIGLPRCPCFSCGRSGRLYANRLYAVHPSLCFQDSSSRYLLDSFTNLLRSHTVLLLCFFMRRWFLPCGAGALVLSLNCCIHITFRWDFSRYLHSFSLIPEFLYSFLPRRAAVSAAGDRSIPIIFLKSCHC